jgi:hypothetical protein
MQRASRLLSALMLPSCEGMLRGKCIFGFTGHVNNGHCVATRVLDSTVTVHAVGKLIELFTVDGSLDVLGMLLRSGVDEWLSIKIHIVNDRHSNHAQRATSMISQRECDV